MHVFCCPGAQNDSLISKTDIRLLTDRRTIQSCPVGGMVWNHPYCDSFEVFCLSFLNAYLVGLHAKEFFRTIYNRITHNVIHCNGQLLLVIMPNNISESVYFVVRPCIYPKFSTCKPYLLT